MAVTEALETQLAGLDADQLRSLLLGLVGEDPGLAARLDQRVLAIQSPPVPVPPAAVSAPDVGAIRREVRSALRESAPRGRYDDDYYGVAGAVAAAVQEFLTPAEELIEAGQGREALAVLEVVTEEFLKGWEGIQEYDEEGECGSLFADLGALWAEAILTVDLAAGERKSWAKRLREWQAEVEGYLDEAGFTAAALAAEQGWDYPPLVRVLQGEITAKGAWEGDAPKGADELAIARLNILEQQGRLQEYLSLAEAEGQVERHLTMLVRLGRVPEAVAAGRASLTAPDQVLVVAQALFEHGDPEEALSIAQLGLTLEPLSGVRGGETAAPELADDEIEADEEYEAEPRARDAAERRGGRRAGASISPWQVSSYAGPSHKADLARWLRDTATALGQPGRALPAARMVL
ncbi:MAG: hypothetical protein ACR2HB_14495, partial [Dehalococcoidia bacterium]